MIGSQQHGHRHRGPAVHHDASPRSVGHRSPLPWFVVAIVAGFAVAVLG